MTKDKQIEELQKLVMAYRHNLEVLLTYPMRDRRYTSLKGDSDVTTTVNLLGAQAAKLLGE